jgi:phage/plasmid-like protein (TIGR03299 family)
MAHEIDNTNGQDNFAFVGKEAWHGLGQKLEKGASKEAWRKAAGYDWECLVIPSQYEFNGKLLTSDNFHMVRSDTGASLGCMTDRYKPVQPAEVLDFFDDFVRADERFHLETAGVLKGGKVLFATARFHEDMDCAGDKHNPFVLFTTSFDGKLATTAQATMVRVVCNNTLTASLWDKDAQVKVRHCTKWTPEVADRAHNQLAEIAGQFDQYKVMAEAMAMAKQSKQQTEDMLNRIFTGKKEVTKRDDMTTNAKNQFDKLFGAYIETVNEGTQAGTAWATLNAVTRYVDHDRTTRDHSGEGVQAARMTSSLMGSGAAMKARAVEMLLEYTDENTTADTSGSDFAALLGKSANIGKGKLSYAA